MKSTLRTPPTPARLDSARPRRRQHQCKEKKHINPDHPRPDKSRVLHRLPGGYIDIKSRSWHGMKLVLLPHAAPRHQRLSSGHWKGSRFLKFVLVWRHLFFYSAGSLPNAAWGGEKKKLEGNGIFWFPHYEHSTALSQHLLAPSINGLVISAGIPSAPTGRPQIWDPSRHAATV